MPDLSAEKQALKLYPNSEISSCTEIEKVAFSISAILEGDDIIIPLDVADLTVYSTF